MCHTTTAPQIRRNCNDFVARPQCIQKLWGGGHKWVGAVWCGTGHSRFNASSAARQRGSDVVGDPTGKPHSLDNNPTQPESIRKQVYSVDTFCEYKLKPDKRTRKQTCVEPKVRKTNICTFNCRKIIYKLILIL